jgi:predicted Zn finger-like uncharacterized protein
MKIVCDSCQAKYSIADEKIQGKAFKIRCKKCNHIIVVKSSTERSPAPAVQKPQAAAAIDAAVWHIVVDSGQVGPLPLSDVKTRLSQGQIRGDTLVWKDGLAEWVALSSVPELAPFVTSTEGESVSAASTAASGNSSSVSTPTTTANSTNSTTTDNDDPSADAFAAPTIITPKGADLFASPNVSTNSSRPAADPAATPLPATSSPFTFGGTPPPDAALVRASANSSVPSGMTGQRNENSVLFSLSNLEALAVPAQARVPSTTTTTEGSGLIDIRSMAAVTLSKGTTNAAQNSMDALPTFSTPQFSPVAPLLLPETTNSAPKWVFPVLGLIGLAIFILGYALIKVVSAPPPGQPAPVVFQPVAPQVAPLAPPVVPATKPVAAAPVKPAPKPEATPTDSDKSEKNVEKAAQGVGVKRGKKVSKEGEAAVPIDSSKKPSEHTPTESTPAATAAIAKPAPKKGSMDDVLGDVGGSKRAVQEEKKPAERLVSLTQSDIVSAMRAIQPKIQACANQFKVPGTALADISVARGGKVGSAVVKGKFAGSPTGACVETAVKTAKFPQCESITFPFPFTLSPR